MSTFQIPDVQRFEFNVPGDTTTYSIPSMLDLPSETMEALTGFGDLNTKDVAALESFKELIDQLADADDTASRDALRSLTTTQKVAFIAAYGEASSMSLGELPAS